MGFGEAESVVNIYMGDTESFCSRVFDSGWNQSRKDWQKVEVYSEVLIRLRELNVPEALVPGFEDELWAHFHRLPTRYALDMNVERAQDVLMHKRLLHMARNPATTTGPAVEVRLVQVRSASGVHSSKSFHSNSRTKVCPQDSDIPGDMRLVYSTFPTLAYLFHGFLASILPRPLVHQLTWNSQLVRVHYKFGIRITI